ncbi:protein kinase domain-containing protein [Ktedonospora formicarum]|uniref:Serine/threonine protein kinase n=1 Tax=Ktedonospora formicarum TaxID=2778364 RepID=A0A8J3HUF8_9CHLR|nr:protein kinase [Ktedonospora formicarum]GHO44222.1 hypothetical protein KSX_23850 [Ktedonospora formicarum]
MVENIADAISTGAAVGRYQLKQLLQKHPWGPIFLAHNREGQHVMLRLLEFQRTANPAHRAPSPEEHMIFLGRFQQEANQVADLRHSHILPLLDYGSFRGTAFLVYPYVSLVPLSNLLTRGRSPDVQAVGLYLEQIISALEYAHECAVLHRNLSVNNIFLHNNRHVLLSEFGLLRMREHGLQIWERTQGFEGHSESSAPEQLLGRSVDAYTDIYALGTLIFHLLTGQPVFQGSSREDVMRQHLYAEPPSLHTRRIDIPEGLDALMLKAMAKEPQMRFHRPSEVLQAYYQAVAPERLPVVATLIRDAVQLAGMHPAPQKTTHSSARAGIPRSMDQSSSTKSRLSRRTLLATGGSTAVAMTAIGIGLLSAHNARQPSLAGTTNQTPVNSQPTTSTRTTQDTKTATPNSKSVLARTKDIPINMAKTFPLKDQKNPGVLVHLSNNTFVAYDTTCTHEGCSVEYSQTTGHLECPCHGSVFDPAHNASVLQGPANMPLKALQITVQTDGTITMV